MSKHAAFLRGVNLGTKRRVSSEQLRALFEGIGFGEVATFRTSGNVVFDAAGRSSRADLAQRVERAFTEELGWESKVFLRTAAELREIAAHEPFGAELVAASEGKLQVVLLDKRPSAREWSRTLALSRDEDQLAAGRRELYWLPSRGVGRSQLDLKAAEATLGPTTVRTKGTIELLTAKYLRS